MSTIKTILRTALFMQCMIMTGASARGGSLVTALSTNVFYPEAQSILHANPNTTPNKTANTAIPHELLLSTENGPSTIPIELATIHETSFLNDPSLRKILQLAKTKAEELHLDQVASDIGDWIEHHPWQAAFYAASALGFFAPEILSIPALEALGFAFEGVRAGSMAAKIQSVIGPVAARSVFAIWQSARMGGYGVEYVNGGVRALVALADATVAACNPLVDCKGLMSDAGQRLLEGFWHLKTAMAVGGGWFAVFGGVLG
ncbi:MAG: hypothetical protein Q9186_007204 [Xanthomendoza sp. 1 TL-2023]